LGRKGKKRNEMKIGEEKRREKERKREEEKE
jgi:hypothetical protein